MSRPMKADEDRKANILRIRLRESDRGVIEAAAKAEGEDCSSWARTVLLRAAKRKVGTVETTWTVSR